MATALLFTILFKEKPQTLIRDGSFFRDYYLYRVMADLETTLLRGQQGAVIMVNSEDGATSHLHAPYSTTCTVASGTLAARHALDFWCHTLTNLILVLRAAHSM